jgi:hypothetical protein
MGKIENKEMRQGGMYVNGCPQAALYIIGKMVGIT